MRRLISLLCMTLVVWFVMAQHAEKLTRQETNPCLSKTSCSQCIQTPGCEWCKQLNFTNTDGSQKPRCNTVGRNLQSECRATVSPDTTLTIIENEALSYSSASGGAAAGKKVVQLKPQKLSLKLRVREEYSLKVSYAQAEDYPVDLYYLMDLSKSMEDDKTNLAKLGSLIAERMGEITSNFRLGFGSFVDKVVMPYVNTVPEKLKEPCSGCAAPYGYKNHMRLTTKADIFEESVNAANVSGNLDGPEGGFDAIMQVMACDRDIGWRDAARRLLLFSTDAAFHYAGDGKLGGIVTPNDGQCHLDNQGRYTHSELLDYPSVSQINKMAISKRMNLIFAVTSEREHIYEQLRNAIQGASLGILSNDSSNVVDLIEEEYRKIRSEVELQTKGASEHVQMKFYSNCLGNSVQETHKCGGLKIGDKVDFDTRIMVTRAPEDRDLWEQMITIYPVGVPEALQIHLTILGDCDCEREGNPGFVKNASVCNYGGNLMCGICKCDGEHFGRRCECDQSTGDVEERTDNCRPDNTTEILCSGRGECSCGVCICHSVDGEGLMYQGDYCECDNFSCDRHNGVICSGSDHGTCECGKCKCNTGWTGSACECDDSLNVCVAPGDSVKCSGVGECVCGECQCFESEQGRYHGTYCEEEPTILGRCSVYKSCVQCKVFDSGELTKEECMNETICSFEPIEVDEVEVEEESEEKCTFTDDDDCQFTFVYGLVEPNDTFSNETGKVLVVKVQRTKECPPVVNILAIVVGLIIAIVAVGLAVLFMWKIFTTIHDRREFAKFEKDRMMARWQTGENPIYKQATTTFKNPTYGGKG